MIDIVAGYIVALFIVLIALWFLVHYRSLIYLKDIPGPFPLPIIGNAHQISSDTVELLSSLCKYQDKYGGLYKIFMGYQDAFVVITDVKFLEFLLGTTKLLNKSLTYRFLHNWLGNGLLTSTGAKWRKHRKAITPAFHFKILEQFLEVFEKNDNIFIKKLEQELNSESFDIFNYVTLLALDNIAETAMRTKINAQNDTHSEYVKSVRKMTKIVIQRTFDPLLSYDWIYKLSPTYQTEKKCLKVLHTVTTSVIKERKLELQADKTNRVSANKENDTGVRRKLAFIDLLLESTVDGKPLTDEQLMEEVDTFMFEGHDTTASGSSFLIYALATHPEVQEKVVDELRSILADDKKRPFTYSDFQNMKYLDNVVKESLRVYPSVPLISREAHEDVEYEGIIIPKGTTLMIYCYGLLRDPKWFPDPEKFDPDRFSNTNDLHPYAYIPFSAGPRNCIGQKYAMLEIKSTICSFLRHYKAIEVPNSKVIPSNEGILKSRSGIRIRIEKRNF